MDDAKAKLIGITVSGIFNLAFAVVVAWAAIEGGSLGQGFAIFIVILNVRAGARSLAEIETVAKRVDESEGRKP